jgi:M6 family metalloprotease-like protein
MPQHFLGFNIFLGGKMLVNNTNQKIIIALFIIVFTILELNAAWVDNMPSQLTQPDGTVIDVLLSGDEFHNWPHDKNGFTIIPDYDTGFYCWAIPSSTRSGDVISSGYPIHLHTPQSLGLQPGINISAELYHGRRAEHDRQFENSNRNEYSRTTGTINNIVIFIRFADQSNFSWTSEAMNTVFNSTAENTNSMHRYFYDASHGQLNTWGHFYPIPGTTILSYQSPNPRSFYANSSANRRQLLLRAVNHIASQVPPTLVIDSNNNGQIDNLIFMVRGNSGAWASSLWSHMSFLSGASINGKSTGRYNFNMEDHFELPGSGGVSLLAHEFGHTLGSPDFYRYPNQGQPGTPSGIWELMATNSNPPQSMSSHIKSKYMGWINIPTVTTSGVYTLYPSSVYRPNRDSLALRINSPNLTGGAQNSQYFVVEYRRRQGGVTDSTVPGSGLLVWRAVPGINGNASGPPDELYVFRPNGSPTNEGNINSANLSNDVARPEISDLTNPYTFLQNGALGGLIIRNISTAGETISFYVDIDGPDPTRIDESFETQSFTSHDWINDQTHPWVITNTSSVHGTHSASNPSLPLNSSTRLELNFVSEEGYFQFQRRTSTRSGQHFLRFYLNGALLDSWSGETPWGLVGIFLPAGTHKVVFEYSKNDMTPVGQDRVWIDNVAFPPITGFVNYPPRNFEATVIDRSVTLNWSLPFETTLSNPPSLLGYNLYQSGNLLASLDSTILTYNVANSAGGPSMHFFITALYDQIEGESSPSNSQNISMPFAVPHDLAATMPANGVHLTWAYDFSHINLRGFRVYRSGVHLTTGTFVPADTYWYLDETAVPGTSYSYDVRALFQNPTGVSGPSIPLDLVYVSDSDELAQSVATELYANYPNPFNPETVINFRVGGIEGPGFENATLTLGEKNVRISIYNLKGQLVRELLNNELAPGMYSVVWDGTDETGREVSSGVYFYRMTIDDFSATRQMLLMK